jgi:hypothetical protein
MLKSPPAQENHYLVCLVCFVCLVERN